MKKHRVTFLNGPAEGNTFLLDPHDTKVFVVYSNNAGRKVLAIVRKEESMNLSVTDKSVAVATYRIAQLKGEKDCWYVATITKASQDHLLAILVGKVTGEGYTSGHAEESAIVDHLAGA